MTACLKDLVIYKEGYKFYHIFREKIILQLL